MTDTTCDLCGKKIPERGAAKSYCSESCMLLEQAQEALRFYADKDTYQEIDEPGCGDSGCGCAYYREAPIEEDKGQVAAEALRAVDEYRASKRAACDEGDCRKQDAGSLSAKGEELARSQSREMRVTDAEYRLRLAQNLATSRRPLLS